jgi:selenocysteine-specific elongation factor
LRVLGHDELEPGERGLVRVHLSAALPLLPGDRYVLRERGRDETVGGGEVLDVAPVLPASRARPDRSVDRVVAERGWNDAVELEAITGCRIEPTVGRWVVSAAALASSDAALHRQVAAAGATGLDIAALDERARALVARAADIRVESGRVRQGAAGASAALPPQVVAIQRGGASPPEPVGLGRDVVRDLIRRGVLVELDGIVFGAEAVDAAAQAAARLLRDHPDGITLSQLRDALGTTRKYAVPLASALDARGITRRRGDLRIAGPRLPVV